MDDELDDDLDLLSPTRATTFASILLSQFTGQYLPTHFLAVAAITAATITAKQTARQPREGGVNMMDNTDNATALPNVCSWFLQLSDCRRRLQNTLLR